MNRSNLITYAIVLSFVVLLAYMTERDNQYATWYELKELSNGKH